MLELQDLKHLKTVFYKKKQMPVYLIFYVTDRCNLKCSHCFYWEELNKKNEIDLHNIEKLTKSVSNLINVGFTGGEPFLRQDIDKIIHYFRVNSGMRIASIPTNGTLTKLTLEKVDRIMSENHGLYLHISVSIDGSEKLHEQIRGMEGCFSKSMETLKGLLELKKKYSRLDVGIICTLTGENDSSIKEVFDYITDTYKVDFFQINMLRGKPKSAKLSGDSLKHYKELLAETEKKIREGKIGGYKVLGGDLYTATNLVFRDMLVRTFETGKYQSPCYAGITNGIIYPTGDVFACEIRADSKMGNLKDVDYDLRKIWLNEASGALRKDIKDTKCFCTFECQLSTNVLFNPKQLAKAAVKYADLKARKLFNGAANKPEFPIPVTEKQNV
ncbi:radical SAM protein [Candidatus Woesearchaeota archaeon]|nr:radical SAM protein [Candidatus Woesearchaeota archaeon]